MTKKEPNWETDFPVSFDSAIPIVDMIHLMKRPIENQQITCVVKKSRTIKAGQVVTSDDVEIGLVLPSEGSGTNVMKWTADLMKKVNEQVMTDPSEENIYFLSEGGTQTVFPGDASYRWPERRPMVKIKIDKPARSGWFVLRYEGKRVMTLFIVEGKPLHLDNIVNPIMIDEADFIASGVHTCSYTPAEPCLECTFGHVLREQRPEHMMIRHDHPTKPLFVATLSRYSNEQERREMMSSLNAYFGEGSALANAAKFFIDPPQERKPSVKSGTFCKRCNEGFKLEATCGYAVNMENCPRCAHFITVGEAFEEVGRFITKIEEMVIGFWMVDPIIVAEVKLRAELPDEDIDLEAMELSAVYDNEDLDPTEHHLERDRRGVVERKLFHSDWRGRASYWRSAVFNMLATQWKRESYAWPFQSLWAWSDGSFLERVDNE